MQRNVLRIQKRIFRATREGDFRTVKNLQELLSRSRGARLVAVRRVTQINQGRNTAGIDGKTCTKDEEKERLVDEIRGIDWDTYRCSPVRRTRIPKPGKREKRPLGIPIMKDRAMQAIIKSALEPEWEAKFEQNSYGFRPGRRCMDAVRMIHDVLAMQKGKTGSAWILDADIAKCFDMIDHEALLKKIPVFTSTIRRWLKAGAIEFGRFYKTRKGTPQGGVISPLLANIALDGMDRLFDAINSKGRYCAPAARKGKNKGIIAIRYADDFVVIAPSRETLLEYVIPRLREFLKERGLSLSGAKTRIVHREEGFDFLGFHVQQYNRKNHKICIVKPSKEKIQGLLSQVKDTLRRNRQATQAEIIDKLNQKIRGWAYYYRYCNAKETFAYVDFRVWEMLWRWCVRRHKQENKGKKWVMKRYFRHVGNRKWTFADTADHALFLASSMKCNVRDYAKVKGDASPFDPSLQDYWRKRHGKIPQEA